MAVMTSQVTAQASIVVGKVLYTVPARLTGQQLRVLVHDNRLECFWHGERVEVLPT